ncbi:MAG TPA: hypothetical protein V6D17_08980 [Candidatus Obscuribacterales bacterium]
MVSHNSSPPSQSAEPSAEPPRVIAYDPALKFFIRSLILFYFVTSVVSLLPHSPLEQRLKSVLQPTERALGLTQNWRLFSPELRQINYYPVAVITFADGSTKLYEFPRLEKMSLSERFRRQKLCKLFQDSLPWSDFHYFWPYAARYVARANTDPENQPQMVALAYAWVKGLDFRHYVKQGNLPEPNRLYTFFVYRVTAEDLK